MERLTEAWSASGVPAESVVNGALEAAEPTSPALPVKLEEPAAPPMTLRSRARQVRAPGIQPAQTCSVRRWALLEGPALRKLGSLACSGIVPLLTWALPIGGAKQQGAPRSRPASSAARTFAGRAISLEPPVMI